MTATQQSQLDRAFQVIRLIAEGHDMNAVGWEVCPWCHGNERNEDTHEPCVHCAT